MSVSFHFVDHNKKKRKKKRRTFHQIEGVSLQDLVHQLFLHHEEGLRKGEGVFHGRQEEELHEQQEGELLERREEEHHKLQEGEHHKLQREEEKLGQEQEQGECRQPLGKEVMVFPMLRVVLV